jgi:membrane-associated protease RseP (regulator of RpoE activity)
LGDFNKLFLPLHVLIQQPIIKDKEAMNETTDHAINQPIQQADFEKLTTMVSAEFQVEEALMERNVPTYYLKQPQETKQSFLRMLKNLKAMNLIAVLRRIDGKIVLKIIPKPPIKPSNILVNWILFFATIATTFVTGYILSLGLVEAGAMSNPLIGSATFTIAIMVVLGMHEMGHKLTADRRRIEATPPYFIPGPPPLFGILGIGTFGAVIMQKSLPPNKDALFDVGSSGPIVGFILAVIVSIVGLLFSPIFPIEGPMDFLPTPLIFELFAVFVVKLPANYYILLHPVAFAGWVGMVVTMLNLLPAGMLDGGHVARSLVGEKTRKILTALSVLLLIVEGFWPMAFLVLFMSMYRHPGPLDDVSSLSTSRKLLAIVLIAIFVSCSFPLLPIF